MRRRDFLKWAAALWCGRRDGTGPPPPASTVLRIALARDGLRPPLTPETSGGPQGQQSGQPKGAAPVSSGALPPGTRPHLAGITPGTQNGETLEHDSHHWTQADTCSITSTRQKNYKADRRSAAELSLNRSRGAPLCVTADCG